MYCTVPVNNCVLLNSWNRVSTKQTNFSVETETIRNSICFGWFFGLVHETNKTCFGLFRVCRTDLFRNNPKKYLTTFALICTGKTLIPWRGFVSFQLTAAKRNSWIVSKLVSVPNPLSQLHIIVSVCVWLNRHFVVKLRKIVRSNFTRKETDVPRICTGIQTFFVLLHWK
jgi:hypothetical protein